MRNWIIALAAFAVVAFVVAMVQIDAANARADQRHADACLYAIVVVDPTCP